MLNLANQLFKVQKRKSLFFSFTSLELWRYTAVKTNTQFQHTNNAQQNHRHAFSVVFTCVKISDILPSAVIYTSKSITV